MEESETEEPRLLKAPARRGWFPWLRRLLRVRVRTTIAKMEPQETPIVVIACERCGFDYSITKIDFGEGRIGAFWLCACGSKYIPPGGEDSFNLVRP